MLGRLDKEGAVRDTLICSNRIKEEWLWAYGLEIRQTFYLSKYIVSNYFISLLQVKDFVLSFPNNPTAFFWVSFLIFKIPIFCFSNSIIWFQISSVANIDLLTVLLGTSFSVPIQFPPVCFNLLTFTERTLYIINKDGTNRELVFLRA